MRLSNVGPDKTYLWQRINILCRAGDLMSININKYIITVPGHDYAMSISIELIRVDIGGYCTLGVGDLSN